MYLQVAFVLVLFVAHNRGEVVNNSFTECNFFFYKNRPPQGLLTLQLYNKAICQFYGNKYHYATLYNTGHRIPMFSAYTLDEFSCNQPQRHRRSRWFIEPQLSGPNYPRNMDTETTLSETHKIVQAINIDFPNTNYDRGHLNPSFYQCDDTRTATFTLTNAVPQDPCFNQGAWKEVEEESKKVMEELCNFQGAVRYFVTGAVPGLTNTIPTATGDNDDTGRDFYRVNVPSGMWTAACCDSSNAVLSDDRKKGFSFSYFGVNKPDSFIVPLSVGDLDLTLALMYRVPIRSYKTFADNCYSNSVNSRKAINRIYRPVERDVVDILVEMGSSSRSLLPDSTETFHNFISQQLKTNKAVSLENWNLADAEFALAVKRSKIQSTRELFSSIPMGLIHSASNIIVSRRNLKLRGLPNNSTIQLSSQDTESARAADPYDKYIVVPANLETITASGSHCRRGHSCSFYGETYQWCYTDWSNNWDRCCYKECGFEQGKDYAWCYASNGTEWAYCSKRSSVVTISGKSCTPGHECGLHKGWNHWCYTDVNKNWDYCCQPSHTCDKHGETNKWCWVGWKNNTNKQDCNY